MTLPAPANSSDTEFARIADAAPVPMWVTGLDRRRSFVNRAYVDFLGVDDAAALAFDWRDRLHPDDLDRIVAESIAGEAALQPFTLEGRYARADGAWRWLRSVSQPRFDSGGAHSGFIGVAHDITDAKEAEHALREREQQLTALFDQTAAGFAQVDLLGRFTLVNDRFCTIVGRAREELMRLTMAEITHPDDLPRNIALLRELLRVGTPFTLEKRYRRPDDSAVWVSNSVSLIRRPDDTPYSVLAVTLDVTERRAAEAARHEAETALAESERQLRLAVEGARIGTWHVDLTTGRGGWSPRTAEIMGVAPDARLSTRQRAEMVHPDDRARIEEGSARLALRGSEFDTEYRIIRADGAVRWVASHGAVMRDEAGTAIRAIGTLRDVTTRREAVEALHALNQTLEQQVAERTAERDRMWRLSRDLLLIVDRRRRVAAVNPAIAELGYRPAEMVGRPLIDFIHPDDRSDALAAVRTAARSPLGEFHARLRAADGDWRCFSWSAAPGEGEAYVIGRDVTAEMQRRDDLERAQDALRQAQKMESLGQLTGGVAHDFNNLLTPIIGNLDLLRHRAVLPERQQRLVTSALESAERARMLVQRLLAFARRQPLQAGPVDLAALVSGLRPLIVTTVGPQVEVVVKLAPDLPAAVADANQLELALLNLAVNARDAMPDGGLLTVAALPVADPPDLPRGNYVALSFADNGVGMDAATLERAVEPFFSTKGVGKGTGLGLSMVHGLTSQLGGTMQLASAPGRGTRVALLLPVADTSAAPAPAEPVTPTDQTGRILLVDDEPGVRAATAEMLENLGFTVAVADSGEAALAMLADRPDILVTDHLMPGMTGADLALVARDRDPALRILVISGYAELDAIPAVLPRLAKPFRLDELAASIAAL